MSFPTQLWAMTPALMGYMRKVLTPNPSIGYDPSSLIGFWPQNELAGGVSIDHSGLGHDGAYTGVDLGQPGVPGMGMSSAGYGGATSFNNIHTAGFANDNPLLNPGFETAGGMPPVWANWSDNVGDGAIDNEIVIVHEGTDAAKLTSGITSNTRTQQAYAVVPGQRRRLRFWARGDGANAGRYNIYDVTNGDFIFPITSTGVTAAAYGMAEREYVVPAGCVLVYTRFWCPDVNGGIAYFDACEDRRMDGFLGDRGTLLTYPRVANAGVWTDATIRMAAHVYVDGNNYVSIARNTANNRMDLFYKAGGVAEASFIGGLTTTDFMSLGQTWDVAAGVNGEQRIYLGGVQQGVTATLLGVWVGNPGRAVIGASSVVPANIWSGNIGPVLLYNEAKTPAEMLYLSTV